MRSPDAINRSITSSTRHKLTRFSTRSLGRILLAWRPLMRIGVALAFLALSSSHVTAQQAAPSQDQPGLKWPDEQIRKTAQHVQAGRKLTPKTWPNGARVAVCISVDPDNFTITLNAGNTNPAAISAGEYGA